MVWCRIGEKAQDPLALLAGDVLTAPANLAGIPALSVPCGRANVRVVCVRVGWREQ